MIVQRANVTHKAAGHRNDRTTQGEARRPKDVLKYKEMVRIPTLILKTTQISANEVNPMDK